MCEHCTDDPKPALNVALIKDLLEWARDDDEKAANFAKFAKFKGWGNWNQEVWAREVRNGVCQSAYCMAGQAVVQAGYAILYQETDSEFDAMSNSYKPAFTASECAPQIVVGTTEKGHPKYEPIMEHADLIENTARRVLGLTRREAEKFFYSENDRAELVSLANEFAAARDLVDVTFE